MIMLQTWRITPTKTLKLETTASTLDDVTRELPEGYYSTFRTYAGGRRVLGLAAHLRRLYTPVSAPEVDMPSLGRQLRTRKPIFIIAPETDEQALTARLLDVYRAVLPSLS